MNEPLSSTPTNGRKSEQTLDSRLSRILIREIIENRYPPGSWLREQEISNRHGVSRASVREALRSVARAGFVQMQPWRGAQVVSLTLKELLDVFNLLEALFAQCARLTAERVPDALVAPLEDLVTDLEQTVAEGGQRPRLYAISFRLGYLIGRHSGNQLAYRMLLEVGHVALWQQHLLLPGTDESEQQSLRAHRMMVSAIRERQPEMAAAAARMVVMINRSIVENWARAGAGGKEP